MEIDSRDLVVNSFDNNNFKTLEDGSVKRLTIDEIGNSALIQAYNKYVNTNESNFIINNGKDKLYIKLTPHHKDGFDWLVVTDIPESLFVTNIIENHVENE